MRATRLFAYAQRLAAQDRLEDALAMFERIAALQAESAGLYLHWGLTLSEANRLDAAVDRLQQAIASTPTNAVLPLFLGQIWFDHGHYAEARTWCETTLRMKPRQWRAAALLGLIDIALGDIDAGYKRLQQPQTTSLTFAARLMRRCIMKKPPALYQQISSMWQSRLLLVVETYLMRHATEARTLAYQLLMRPEAQRRQRVWAVDRVLIHSVMGLQRQWYRLRHTAQRDVWLLYAQAEEAYYLGQFQAAARLYARLEPTFPARQQVEERLYEMAYTQADFSSALQHWRRYLDTQVQARPSSAIEAFVLGELQLQKGDYHGAARSLEHVAHSPWRDYRVPYYQGLCHLHQGARREARRCFAAATDMINPDLATLRLEELYRVAQVLQPASEGQTSVPSRPDASDTGTPATPSRHSGR